MLMIVPQAYISRKDHCYFELDKPFENIIMCINIRYKKYS